jgi:hypothetical protein
MSSLALTTKVGLILRHWTSVESWGSLAIFLKRRGRDQDLRFFAELALFSFGVVMVKMVL